MGKNPFLFFEAMVANVAWHFPELGRDHVFSPRNDCCKISVSKNLFRAVFPFSSDPPFSPFFNDKPIGRRSGDSSFPKADFRRFSPGIPDLVGGNWTVA